MYATSHIRPRRRGRLLACSALTLLGLALGACGGDDDAGLSRQEFVAKADTICKEANRREAELGPGETGWHYGPKFNDPDFLSRFSAVSGGALRKLRALEPVPAERARVDDVLSAMEARRAAMDSQIAGLRAEKRDIAAANVRAYETAYGDLAAAAGPLGLTECQGVGH